MLINKIRLKISFLIGLIFFVVGLYTLPDYGINWDTINHLPRGQAYLHYFLTGKRDFSDLPRYFDGWQKPGQWYFQDPSTLGIKTDLPDNMVPARSMYQIDSMNFNYFLQNDGDGHPPLSDILSAFFNEVLFRRLKLVNDIDSYRIYGILLASVTVGLVFYWASQLYGYASGIVASLSLALYPLFWAESHFNTEKDIPETAYWSLFMFAVWKGVTTKNWKWIIFTGLIFGLALGTKLNIIFALIVIALWLIIEFLRNRNFVKNIKLILKQKGMIISFVLIPVIGLSILILTWPYLWGDPIEGFLKMVGFYKTIGTSSSVTHSFLRLNFYPVKWILFTTPIVILGLFVLGLINGGLNLKKGKGFAELLFILWVFISVFRVVAPGSNIYGGVRQIMEFIPGMALLSAGGFYLITKNINKKIIYILAVIIFLPILFKLISIHPNENAYFNSLIGGLSGAKEQNIPFWGFSFGSPYRQAASWLNKNAPKNAIVVYTYDLIPNLPRIWLRTDLNLYNGSRSGYLRQGEYAMGLTFNGTDRRSYYDIYLEKFMNPVYEVKVDNIAVLKIWKNDQEYLKSEYSKEVKETNLIFKKGKGSIVFELQKPVLLSHLDFKYNQINCPALTTGVVQTSLDGTNWSTSPGVLPDDWRIAVIGEQPKNGKMIEPFAAQMAKYIKFNISPDNACLKNVLTAEVYHFEN